MLHTVFYDTRNALLSVRVWWVRAELQQVERPENNARQVYPGGRRVRTGLDLAGLALTGHHSAASALISLIAAVLQLERSSFIQSSASLSSPVSKPPVVMWSWCSTSSSVSRRQYYGDPRKITGPIPSY